MTVQDAHTKRAKSSEDRRSAPRDAASDRRRAPRSESRKALSELARELSQAPVKPNISPVVVSGVARFSELALMLVSGAIALSLFSPEETDAFWLNALLIPAVVILAVIGFEAAH